MRAVASFHLVNTELAEALRPAVVIVEEQTIEKKLFRKVVHVSRKDGFWDWIRENAETLREFDTPVWVFDDLRIFLENHAHIDLSGFLSNDLALELSGKRGYTVLVFRQPDVTGLIEQLDSVDMSESVIGRFLNEIYGENAGVYRVLFSTGEDSNAPVLPDPFPHGGELICDVRPALAGTHNDQFHVPLLTTVRLGYGYPDF